MLQILAEGLPFWKIDDGLTPVLTSLETGPLERGSRRIFKGSADQRGQLHPEGCEMVPGAVCSHLVRSERVRCHAHSSP